MGGTTFGNFGKGATARDAFDALTAEARYMDGHGGYTGTIAEKRSFVMVGEAATHKEARAKADAMIDAEDPRVDDKWGPAGCIAVGAPGSTGTRLFYFFGWASC